MNKRSYQRVIEYTVIENISSKERKNLIDIFEYVMALTAATRARRVFYNTSDFPPPDFPKIEGFELEVIRKTIVDKDIWEGIFTRNKQRLEVVAFLGNMSELINHRIIRH